MRSRWQKALPRPIAFVHSGGANLGSIQVGMLQTLRDVGIHPDIVVGTSVGSLNGAVIANYGLDRGVDVLEDIWHNLRREDIFPGGLMTQAMNLVRSKLHLYPSDKLADLIQRALTVERFAELQLPFAVTATKFVTREGVLFTKGELLTALMASTAIPGVYPPVERDGEQYVDGGITANVPLHAAVQLGAKSLVVLDTGNICRPTATPSHVVELLQSMLSSALRQRVLVEAPELARRHPILYLPTPCTTDMSMLDFDRNQVLMAEAAALTADFLNDAPIPQLGAMTGKPHFHEDGLV